MRCSKLGRGGERILPAVIRRLLASHCEENADYLSYENVRDSGAVITSLIDNERLHLTLSETGLLGADVSRATVTGFPQALLTLQGDDVACSDAETFKPYTLQGWIRRLLRLFLLPSAV